MGLKFGLHCKKTVYTNGVIEIRDAEVRLHCIDGPAFENKWGHKEWLRHGKLHRLEGPAIVYPNGTVYYCINGKELTKGAWEYSCSLIKE